MHAYTIQPDYHTAHKHAIMPAIATLLLASVRTAPAVGAKVYAKLLVGFGLPLTETVARSCWPFAGAGGLLAFVGFCPAGRMEKRSDMEYMTPWVLFRKRRK